MLGQPLAFRGVALIFAISSNRPRTPGDRRRHPMIRSARSATLSLLALFALSSPALAQSCVGSPVAVQILGSNGPALNPNRASASYLLWVGSQARVLVDLGGGSHLRYAQSGAKFADLSLIAVSHLHPDHISDLPSFMWSTRNSRGGPLAIAGPSGNDVAPSFSTFLDRLFDPRTGAFQVLGPIMADAPGNQGVVHLDAREVDVTKTEPTTVFDADGMTVRAFRIPHGNLPALAYRVETRGMSVVFSSDQNGSDPRFVDFARGANVLVMHLATNQPNNPLHAAPAVVGRIAQSAGVKRLIVSHLGQFELDPAIAELKAAYTGPLTIGADLQCTPAQ
jgi:ribonuclease BN (tRNA processing enzyme)